MVSIVQPDSNEDSQSRQLCMNKRLSKVVSSAPRARFQKARPKVPSLKREPASTPVQTKSQSVTLPDRSKVNKEILTVNGNSNSVSSDVKEFVSSAELSGSQSLLSEELHFKYDFPKTKGMEIESHEDDSADIVIIEDKNCVSSKRKEASSSEEKEVENSTASLVDQTEQLVSASEKNSESCSSSSTNSEDLNEVSSSPPLSENGTVSETCENEICKSAVGKSPSNTDECTSKSVNGLKDATKSPSGSKKETEIEISASMQNSSSVANSKVQGTADANSKDKSHTETGDTLQRSVPNTTAEEKNDISPSSTEKSSKYPHLTSILSKKRIEPKRDVPHKKRKRYKKGDTAPERSKMTMADLIYWNPTSEDAGLKKATNVDDAPPVISNNVEPEECPDDDVQNEEENSPGPVPRLIISEDGEINIDQVSLVIQRKTLPVQNVIERNDDTTYSSFRKRPLSKHWTTKETTIFYKALSLVGTDFGLMEKLLPDRTRRELKLKFKREEKYNIDLVNKAMYDSQLTFDENTLEEHIQMLNSIPEVFEETQESDQSSLKENKRSKGSGKHRRKKSEGADIELLDSPAKTLTNTNGRELNDKEVRKKNNENSKKGASNHNDKNGTSDANDVCNKKKRKKKQLSNDIITIDEDDIDVETDIQYIIGANGKKVNDKNDVSSREEVSDKNGNDTNNRRRKKKKLPDDFISIDDIEDITDLATGRELINDDDSFLYSPKRNHKGINQHKSFQKLSTPKSKTRNETSDDVEIVYLEELTNVDPNFNQETNGTVVIAEGSELTMTQIINDSMLDSESSAHTLPYSSDNQETECVTVNIIQNYDSTHEINTLNVVANEVVTSQTLKAKRRRNVGNALKRPKKVNSVNELNQPSFTNYTPAEESLLPHEKNLQFSPEPNLKTYSKTHSTPESSNVLISSLQTPSVTPLQSSSLLTSLNVSDRQPMPITLTPQANASSNPVMLLAKSPNTDNVIHLFMYKSPSS